MRIIWSMFFATALFGFSSIEQAPAPKIDRATIDCPSEAKVRKAITVSENPVVKSAEPLPRIRLSNMKCKKQNGNKPVRRALR